MMLQWTKRPTPDVQEICRETENEATFRFEMETLEQGKGLEGDYFDDFVIVVCYNEIVGGDSYLTKVKIERLDEGDMYIEWDAKSDTGMDEFIQQVCVNSKTLTDKCGHNDLLNFADSMHRDIESWLDENGIHS